MKIAKIMITEDYVSFEIAKLLKEKGFPQEYDIYHSLVYNEEDYEDEYESQRMVLQTRLVKAGTLSSYPAGVPEPKCYCPTLQMAMKWLREVHDIYIDISIYVITKNIVKYNINVYYKKHKNDSMYIGIHLTKECSKYEQACEAGIKYTLKNLI